jgi:hypothetical protein
VTRTIHALDNSMLPELLQPRPHSPAALIKRYVCVSGELLKAEHMRRAFRESFETTSCGGNAV